MEATKRWFQSTGVWGGIVSVVAGVAGFFGYSIGAEDQAALADSMSQVAVALSSIVAIGGGLMSIVGRVRASKVVKK